MNLNHEMDINHIDATVFILEDLCKWYKHNDVESYLSIGSWSDKILFSSAGISEHNCKT